MRAATPLVPKAQRTPQRSPLLSLGLVVTGVLIGTLTWNSILQEKRKVNKISVDMDFSEDTDTIGPFSIDVTWEDFLTYPKVKAWVESKGVSTDEGSAELFQYVPRLMRVRGDPELIMGGGKKGPIGNVAMTGYTFWSMQYRNSSSKYSSAYTMVIDMRGNIVSISPTMSHFPDTYHFIALKVYDADPRYMIGGIDVEETQTGPAYLWNWAAGDDGKEFIPIMNGTTLGCHDIQLAKDRRSAWVNADGRGFGLYDLKTGENLATYQFQVVWDVNHVQLIEEDTKAIVSSRATNAIVAVDLSSSEIEFVVGGDNGTFGIIDMFGRRHPPGISIWHGQHNVEYIGDDQYVLFDDGSAVNHDGTIMYPVTNSSRLMIIQVNAEEERAQILWTYDLGTKTPYYGDCDKMPSGNILGTHWVEGAVTPELKYQARVIEIVKETKETAWEMLLFGDDNLKKNNSEYGWSIYSADRVYPHPIVYDVTCINGRLEFKVISSYKLHSSAIGYYIVEQDGDKVSDQEFAFNPFWKPTFLYYDIGTCTGDLKVHNKHGQHYTVSITDTAGADD